MEAARQVAFGFSNSVGAGLLADQLFPHDAPHHHPALPATPIDAFSAHSAAPGSIWKDSRTVAAYVAGASATILAVHLLFIRSGMLKPPASPYVKDQDASSLRRHLRQYGGTSIAIFKVAKTLVTTALAVLLVLTAVDAAGSRAFWPTFALAAAAFYSALLAVLSIVLPASYSRITSPHSTLASLGLLGVYIYRDVWPLMTFILLPQDRAEGALVWTKLALATLSGTLLPLLEPFPYIPVNPSAPQDRVNAEQTASIASILFFTFMGAVVRDANKVDHLPPEQLPPLCDYDRTAELSGDAARFLDPFRGGKRARSMLLAFALTFRASLSWQVLMVTLQAVADIGSPIGTNRLLHFLETGGAGALVRPWVWLVWMSLCPLLLSMAGEQQNYLVTGAMVRMQAIVTALVFEHALRVRPKAEAGEGEKEKPAPAAQPTVAVDGAALVVPVAPLEGEAPGASVMARETSSDTAVSEGATSTAVAESEAGAPAKGEEKEKTKKKDNFAGRVNNLVTSDVQNLCNGMRDAVECALYPLLAITFAMVFLYYILGWSAFVGLAVMIILIPVPAWTSKLMESTMEKKMHATDARVETITESMNVIRMIKLFGWETQVKEKIAEKREAEVKILWRERILELVLDCINHVIPLVHMVVTFVIYTLVMKKSLSASVVFSAMTAFDMVRQQVYGISWRLPGLLKANVSSKRLHEFLYDTELLDEFTHDKPSALATEFTEPARPDVIGLANATFAWSASVVDGALTPSSQGFRLRVDDELVFQRGAVNLIIGPTGSGKTSLLMALLGEMHYVPSGPGAFVSLPKAGGVAYAAQESWVLNETIRENILFGSPYDEARYKKVIKQCALERDLQLFDAGDKTEVGEKGITLSGGQKARITLARAIYSKAEIVLLDDVLAALDVHTSRWIVDKCFKGDLLRNRTVLLVTHNIALASPIASFVVALGTDGRILSQGTLSDALAKDKSLAAEVAHEQAAVEMDESEEHASGEPEAAAAAKAGKLIVAEEVAVGRVGWSAFKLLINSMGGNWPILFWVLFMSLIGIDRIIDIVELWWLGWWARQYDLHPPSEVDVPYYLSVYVGIVALVVLFFALSTIVYAIGCVRASRRIHDKLVKSLMTSTFRWLDTTPTSRIIARCTQDIQSIDGNLTRFLCYTLDVTVTMINKLGTVILFLPLFAIPGVAFAAIGLFIGGLYMQAQLPVKRELSNAKAPVLGIVAGAITGLTSIRAYGAQNMFTNQCFDRIDKQTMLARTSWNLNRWIALRMSVLSSAFTAALGFYLIYGSNKFSASNVGFTLVQGLGFSSLILVWIRLYNEVQIEGNSLERIQGYIQIEHEPEPKEGGTPPAYWPASGELRVENLSARYSPNGPKVLQDVSFHIKAGERVGVVGRTGSGKSSLTLALLRCIYTEGFVSYDGVPTHSLNLDALRSSVTIIPQVPELMSGTLRRNLDMFGEHDDAVLNEALRGAGLFSLQTDADENRLTLDSSIASGGGNLSVGQRQIIALARAIVRQSKLLILDEATSAIDYETDTVIQTSLRKDLKSDVTVLTVAHRLQTIMDSDKIMVLDAGRLVEFASPKELLQNEKSFLRALVEESDDKEKLYAMAEGK